MLTQPSVRRMTVRKVRNGRSAHEKDMLAVEEPLEIRLASDAGTSPVAVTMRTPGEDFELAAGFLFCEGIVRHRDEVAAIRYCDDALAAREDTYNIVTVHLRRGLTFDAARLQRNFYTTSSCGVCGKASLEALEIRGAQPLELGATTVAPSAITRLAAQVRQRQAIFGKTGGLHAAALFELTADDTDPIPSLTAVHEDVGRHNAVDKLIGRRFLDGCVFAPPNALQQDCILMVSGRTSFEIMQKALAARIPVVIAVGAPSSLAVELAQQFNITLIGFARGDGFNVYAAAERARA